MTKLEIARELVQARLAEKRLAKKKRSVYTPDSRYDEVYFKGMAWLDSL